MVNAFGLVLLINRPHLCLTPCMHGTAHFLNHSPQLLSSTFLDIMDAMASWANGNKTRGIV